MTTTDTTTTEAALIHVYESDMISAADNVRGADNFGDLDELAASIVTFGILQPLKVQPAANNGDYLVIAGARRLAAVRRAIAAGDLSADFKIPCYSTGRASHDDRAAQMLVENMQRQHLTPYEVYAGFVALASEHGWTSDQIADRLGVSRQLVRTRLAWAKLPDHVLDHIEHGYTTGDPDPITRWDDLARLPADDLADLCADDQVPAQYDVSGRRTEIETREKADRLSDQIRNAGHQVVDEDAVTDEASADKTIVANYLRDRNVESANDWYWGHVDPVELDDLLLETPAGEVFTVTASRWGAHVQILTIDTRGDGLSIARSEVLEAGRRASAHFEEARFEARRQYLALPADQIVEDVINQLADGVVDGPDWVIRRAARLVAVDPETLAEWCAKTRANKIRVIAADLIQAMSGGLEVPDEPNRADFGPFIIDETTNNPEGIVTHYDAMKSHGLPVELIDLRTGQE